MFYSEHKKYILSLQKYVNEIMKKCDVKVIEKHVVISNNNTSLYIDIGNIVFNFVNYHNLDIGDLSPQDVKKFKKNLVLPKKNVDILHVMNIVSFNTTYKKNMIDFYAYLMSNIYILEKDKILSDGFLNTEKYLKEYWSKVSFSNKLFRENITGFSSLSHFTNIRLDHNIYSDCFGKEDLTYIQNINQDVLSLFILRGGILVLPSGKIIERCLSNYDLSSKASSNVKSFDDCLSNWFFELFSEEEQFFLLNYFDPKKVHNKDRYLGYIHDMKNVFIKLKNSIDDLKCIFAFHSVDESKIIFTHLMWLFAVGMNSNDVTRIKDRIEFFEDISYNKNTYFTRENILFKAYSDLRKNYPYIAHYVPNKIQDYKEAEIWLSLLQNREIKYIHKIIFGTSYIPKWIKNPKMHEHKIIQSYYYIVLLFDQDMLEKKKFHYSDILKLYKIYSNLSLLAMNELSSHPLYKDIRYWLTSNFKEINPIDLSNILDYIKAYDNTFEGSNIRKWNKHMNFRNTTEESVRWHNHQINRKNTSDFVKFDNQPIDDTSIIIDDRTYCFTGLKNSNELFQEGHFMKHCVSSYVEKIKKGSSYIYKIEEGTKKERATLEIDCLSKNIIQIYGKANTKVSQNMLLAAQKFIQ